MNLIGTKEGSALVFMREVDGVMKSMKFEFKDNSFYTSTSKDNWRKVKSAGTFFNGFTVSQVINSFEDEQYKEFLRLVLNNVKSETRYSYTSKIGNPSVLLNYIPQFMHLESWLLLGVKFEESGIRRDRASNYRWSRTEASEYFSGIKDPISIFQKEVLSFMRELDIRYSTYWVDRYKEEETKSTIINLCTYVRHEYFGDLEVYQWLYDLLTSGDYGIFDRLVKTHGMEYKALFRYLVKVERTEALAFSTALSYLDDYVTMNVQMRNFRFEKYPYNLTMRHNITARNHRVRSANYPAETFKEAVNYSLDWMNDEYAIVAPIEPKEMIEEGNKLNHCVASYVDKVINKTCQILFMRDLTDGNEPLVTVEVKPDMMGNPLKIGQVSQKGNEAPTEEQVEVLKEFAKAKRLFYKDYDPTQDLKNDQKKLEEKARKEQEKDNEQQNSTVIGNRNNGTQSASYSYQVG